MVLDLVEPLLAGNRRALAKAISHVEDEAAGAQELLAALYPHTGHAHLIGITGAPGTGKSTLVNALARAYRAQGHTVGVVAVDPTSPFSGGALLGDRVRMRDLSGDPGIFIRSMATRGSLGGLARATSDVLTILDAGGFDRILIETVGVGQAEIDIASAAHTTIVVEAPGLGDEVQAIKAGILEIADLFAVNKADREGVDHTVMALQMMQGLAAPQAAQSFGQAAGHHREPAGASRSSHPTAPAEPGAQADGSWLPPITKTVAIRGEGVDALRDWIERHASYLRETGQLSRREVAHATKALKTILADRLMAALLATQVEGTDAATLVARLAAAIARREIDPYTAADQVLASAVARSFGGRHDG